MKNFENPIQPVIELFQDFIQPEIEANFNLTLSANEFTDKNNNVGLLPYEPEPYVFLSEDRYEKQYKPSGETKYNFEIVLSKRKNTIERQVYTLLALIGDLGGFIDGIRIFPALILSIYSSRMFSAALAEDLPVKSDENKDLKINLLKKKLSSGT